MKHTRSAITCRLPRLAALLMLLCLNSCETPQQPASHTQPDDAVTGDTTATYDPDAAVGVMIHRIDLPLDASLDPCWALVDESPLPMLTVGMWQINGMRIGILHAEQATLFFDSLPPSQGESRAKLMGATHPTAIRSTPRLMEPVPVDLTDPPRSPTIYRASDGRLQLLARVARFPETGQPYLELTPHHFKPRPDLIPRNPLEKALDGKVFTPLMARTPLSADTAVIVGLYRTWPQPDESPAVDETQDPSSENTTHEPATDETAAVEIDDTQPDTITIPDSLGKSLLAGLRAGEPTQILLIISMIEEPRTTDADKPGQ